MSTKSDFNREEWGVEVCDEGSDLDWNVHMWEKILSWWVDASGGVICRVFFAGNVSSEEFAAGLFSNIMNASKD